MDNLDFNGAVAAAKRYVEGLGYTCATSYSARFVWNSSPPTVHVQLRAWKYPGPKRGMPPTEFHLHVHRVRERGKRFHVKEISTGDMST